MVRLDKMSRRNGGGDREKSLRLDKMSKQEMGRIWYKELLIRMIIGLQ